MTEHAFIVSAQYLNEHLDDPDIVVVDCRFALSDPNQGYEQYKVSHIPGAHYLDLNKDLSRPVERHGGRHPLPEPGKLAQKLAGIGVNFQKTLVIAYDDSRFAFASRLWWLLRYLGHDQVGLLDGGWKGWHSQGYPVTDQERTTKPGIFVEQLRSDWVVDINSVKVRKDLPEVALVDSRESDRYLGKREPIDPVAGHIPGAINYPWHGVTDTNGYLQPLASQQERWTELENKQEILVYCGSGVTACVNLFSLALAGINTGKLYAGSWSDWCSYL
ncbi:sulfurtransferase [Moorena sp. SIO3H5]|uniref:sulfurtransferase n=1 Tax=Moorena sp. SIO3H5 TaxID=2607834 RepID=UPI0013BC8A46|nr:sulfurtransferase [Moorena sp. SIO3H5]NEO72564.1 sulfurtransferase [Moorena sp. SIO3H5]